LIRFDLLLYCIGQRSALLSCSGDDGDYALKAAVGGFIGRMLLANADALCALASPLLPAQHDPL